MGSRRSQPYVDAAALERARRYIQGLRESSEDDVSTDDAVDAKLTRSLGVALKNLHELRQYERSRSQARKLEESVRIFRTHYEWRHPLPGPLYHCTARTALQAWQDEQSA